MNNKLIIGCEEWCGLPGLRLPAIKVRVDSGARTSSLHAFNIRQFERDGISHVSFDIHPLQHNRKIVKRCEAPLLDQREVKSSSGHVENRPVIRTGIALGETEWEIDITLTNRDSMGYRMLLGRQAMKGRILVDPEVSFASGELSDEEAKRYYKPPRKAVRGLNIYVLASNPELYSNKRLIEAGEQRGHHIRFIQVKYCYMNIGAAQPVIHYRGGEILDKPDAVIPRLRPSATFYGCALLRQFQSMGSYCLNDSVAIARSRDKLRALQMLADQNIDMPNTGFADSPLDTKDLIKMVGGAPLVIKLLAGTQGNGVVLAETNKAAESVINAF